MLQLATKSFCRLQSFVHPIRPSVQARSGAFPSRPFHCSTPVVPVKVNKTMNFGRFALRRHTLLVTNAAIIQKNTLPALDIGQRGTAVIKDIKDYQGLADNKVMLFRVLDDVFKDLAQNPNSGENAKRKALILAMAMQETTHLDVNQRDKSKDQTDAANATMLNMNYDMVRNGAGYSGSREKFLDDLNNHGEASLKTGLKLLITCFDNTNSSPPFGIIPTLNYHRGGYTGFINPKLYGCQEYRDAIATIYNKFNEDPDLLNDSRRVEIDVPRV